jgi:hypothetical protein
LLVNFLGLDIAATHEKCSYYRDHRAKFHN